MIYNKNIFIIRFAINVVNKENSQSSCRYANPFAEPIAIFSLVGQLIVGLSNPVMSFSPIKRFIVDSPYIIKHVRLPIQIVQIRTINCDPTLNNYKRVQASHLSLYSFGVLL